MRDGHFNQCKSCFAAAGKARRPRYKKREAAYTKAWRERNDLHVRMSRVDWYRLKTYGMTRGDYDALIEKQKGLCAMCGEVPRVPRDKRLGLHVDHCHKTGKIRELLCFSCNSALAHLRDDVSRAQAAIRYLRKHV